MAKRQIRVFLEEEDIQVLLAAAKKNDKGLSEICRDIIREKIISGAVDEYADKLLIEKRVDLMINTFEQRLKEIAKNYITIPAKIPTDLLIKSTLYSRAAWEILKKPLTEAERETIYRNALRSVKEAESAEMKIHEGKKPKIELGRKT